MQLNEDLKFFIPRLRDKIQMEGKIISANLLLVYKKNGSAETGILLKMVFWGLPKIIC